MNIIDLIGLADIKEIQAEALIDIYKDKVTNKELQQMIDSYCENMATTFLQTYKKILQDSQMQAALKNYIFSIKADKPHSGHRFYESLYRKMMEMNKNDSEKDLDA